MRVRRVLVVLLFLGLAGLAGWLVMRPTTPPSAVVLQEHERPEKPHEATVRLEGTGSEAPSAGGPARDETAASSAQVKRKIEVEIVTATGRAPNGTQFRWVSVPDDSHSPAHLGRRWCSGVGEVTLEVPAGVPVRVLTRARGHVVWPADQVVAPNVDRIRVELVKACRIAVAVIEADTGKRPCAPVSMALQDLATGRAPPPSPDDTRRGPNVVDFVRYVRPGVYAMTVEAEGYRTWRAPEVILAEPADDYGVAVELEPDPDAGTLVLRVHRPGVPDMIQSFCVLGRRTGAWRRLRPRAEDWGRGHLVLGPLPAGSWDLLVWDGCRRVGRTRAQVRGGQAQHVDVGVAPGLLVPVGKPTSTGEGVIFYNDEPALAVTLRTSSGEALPLVWWDAHQPPAPSRSYQLGGRATYGPRAPAPGTLGPYPFDEIVVEEPAANGKTRRLTVRAE